MEKTNVVKRRGRPNRGGGRFNRGRGRGRPGKHGGGGGEGRKSAGNLLDDNDFYDDTGGSFGSNFQERTQPNRSQRGQGTGRDHDSMRGYPSQRGRGGSRGRGSTVKVAMQHLHMSTENQEMVRDMLRDLHGADNESGGEDCEEEYDELDHRSENQYWMTSSSLQIEGATIHSFPDAGSGEKVPDDVSVSSLARNKLMRYGFHELRCIEALQLCDGDIGLALEYLVSQCFGLEPSVDAEKTSAGSDDMEEILELRNDEMIALQSIYEDRFVDRIPNKVWILRLTLPELQELVIPKSAKSKHNREPTGPGSGNICKFYVKGSCKFGNRCRLRHTKPNEEVPSVRDNYSEEDSGLHFELEIRFPNGNRYPHECPIVALSTTFSNFPKHMCLNITSHLMQEAISMAESSEPSIFTLANLLEDKSLLCDVITLPPHEYSLPPNERPWLRPKSASFEEENDYEEEPDDQFEDEDFSDQRTQDELISKTKTKLKVSDVKHKNSYDRDEGKLEEELIQPVPVQRSSSREEESTRKINPAEILKQNRKLKEEFKRRQTSSSYKSMQVQRQKLPAWNMQDVILDTINEHQVMVVSGMTGCGKTTQVPQFILDSHLESKTLHLCNILCTQPRRISAMAVSERVAEERADKLGRIVGYQIRLEKVQSSMTRLLFCTTGIVLRRLEGDPQLEGVSHIIIDEIHERSEESDFLLMYLRDMLNERKDLKVILMSATLNAALFSEYFGGCPVVDIPGRTYPVDQYYLEDAVEFTGFVMEENSPYTRPLKHMNAVQQGLSQVESGDLDVNLGPTHTPSDRIQDQNLSVKQLFHRYLDYRKGTVKSMSMMDHTKINFDLIVQLLEWIVSGHHEFPAGGAVLVFLPGYAEIQTLFDMLQFSPCFGVRNRSKYKIIPLHSTLSSEDQHAVFNRPPEGVTKIVISTNIAETSITIDDIVFVIDSGKMKEKRYDQSKGMESLDTVWVSKANALQRKGRAGRVTSGVCFHLFTSHRFKHHLQDQPIPEIQRAPLEQIVLRIRMLHIFKTVPVQDVLNQLPEPPEEESINSAVKRLQDLGALDEFGELTPLGYHLGSLPVDVRIGKLMLFGAIFRCLDPALTIAACLSFKSPFVAPFGKKEDATAKKLEFASGSSDHLTMLNAYRTWIDSKKSGSYEAYKFCQENFLAQRTLQMLASMKQQFVELLSDIGFVKEGLSVRDVEKAATGGTDGVAIVTGGEANVNSSNWKLVSAILVGALYPNVVQVLTPESKYSQSSAGAVPKAPKAEELKFKTKQDGYVSIHPSSVNFQVRYYESPYLVYHEKIKTSKVYIRDCTMVSVYPLLLFGGGNISIDLLRGNFILSVDEGWIRFQAASHQVAELVRELRTELDQLLSDKIQTPHMDLCTCPRGSKIIDTIVKLITTQ